MTGTVLIAGAGYVGTQLGLELAEDGHTVFGIRRDATALPEPIRPISGDLLDPGAWRAALPEQIDGVVYAAGADASSPDAYRRVYVEGLARVLEAVSAGRRRPRRVVFTSSTAVYAQTGGEWVDEASPAEPRHFSGQIVLEAERLLLGSGLPASVVRLGGIYGPGRARLIEQVRAGALTAPVRPGYVNRIHRDDCAGAIVHVLGLVEPSPIYLAVDDEPADQATLIEFLAGRLGLPLPESPEGGAPPRRGPPTHKRCSNALLKQSGYRLRWPTYREGYGGLITRP